MDEEMMDCDDRGGVLLSHAPFTYNSIQIRCQSSFHQTLYLAPCLSVFTKPIQCPPYLVRISVPPHDVPKPFRHQINLFRSHEQVSDPAPIRSCSCEGVITTMITT
jgi:hypothetical protein